MTDRSGSRRWLAPGPWLVAGLLLVGLGIPAVASAQSVLRLAPAFGTARPAVSFDAVVNLTDAPAFAPRTLVVPSGTNLTIELHNTGAFVHSFTLSNQTGVQLNRSWTPSELYAYFATNGSLANVSVGPGNTTNVSLPPLTGGDAFEFVSVVPYQFQSGMWGWLNVTVGGPPLVVNETTTDSFAFVPDQLAASPLHYPVTLHVDLTNTGSLAHTFTVAPQTNVTLSPGNFSQYFADHTPLTNTSVPSGSGSTAVANFTVNGPGVYEYICTVAGHFANGMSGLLYVGVTPPPQAPPPSTAIVETWVLVGSAVLLGIGGLIALVSHLVGRVPRTPGPKHGH